MFHETAARNLNGLYAALYTPFDRRNRIDFDRVESLIRFQVARGLNGFFVAGTTGEGLLLSFDERVELVRFVAGLCRHDEDLQAADLQVIAHVGHPSSETAARLAVAAADAGVDWIGSIGPVFYGNSFEATRRHYQCIARATDLPFMIYALQSDLQPDRDCQLFDIPNVAAMKYTGADFFSLQQLAQRVDRDIAWISGMDELFIAGQAMGCQAGIGSTYNFMPEKFVQMLELCRQNDFHAARDVQQKVNKVIDYFCSFENWSYRKAFMRYIGLDCGPCRPPYQPLDENEYLSFAEGLEGLGVLARDQAADWLSETR